MTTGKKFKKKVRARMVQTGESYTQARAVLEAGDAVVHLATGIVCGGSKTWCGAGLEIDDGKVLNATDSEERCTCQGCLAEIEIVREAAL